MCKMMLALLSCFSLIIFQTREVYSAACATSTLASFYKKSSAIQSEGEIIEPLDIDWKFSGEKYIENTKQTHKWEIKFVELSEDLVLDVEIINGDKIRKLTRENRDNFPKPMIFIHGWMDSRLNWMTIIPEILNSDKILNNQIIIIPSLRGFGDSQIFPYNESSFTLYEFVEDILKLLIKLGFDLSYQKFDWIGHSMGGSITIYSTIYFTKYINKIILMDTTPNFKSLNLKENKLFNFDENKNEPTKLQIFNLAKIFNNEQFKNGSISISLQNILNRENIKADSKATRLSFDAITNIDLTNELRTVVKGNNIPTLVLCGYNDFIPWEDQRDYGNPMNAKVVVYADTGHDPHYKFPLRVSRSIVNFLESEINKDSQKQDL